MVHDSQSNSAVFGRFRTLDARLDHLDQVVIGGVAAADQAFPGIGASPGSYKGFVLDEFGGPELVNAENGWVIPDNSLAFKMPGFAPITVPAIHSPGQTTNGFGGSNATLTGTLMGWPGMDFTLPMLQIPSWAIPSTDWLLEDCAAWRIRWVTWPDGAPGFTVVRTDIVNGTVSGETGLAAFAESITVPEIEGVSVDAFFLDFQISSWWNVAGSPPEVRPYEVYQIAMDSIDTSQNWPVGVAEGVHVLVQWVDGDGQIPGIYRVGVDGALSLETTLFDGWHNGSTVWAYSVLTSGHSVVVSPTTWGVYTTEACSLVQLSGPNPSDPTRLAPTVMGADHLPGAGNIEVAAGEARPSVYIGGSGDATRTVTFDAAGYGRFYETDIRVLPSGLEGGEAVAWSDARGAYFVSGDQLAAPFYIHATVIGGGYDEIDPVVYTHSPNLVDLQLD